MIGFIGVPLLIVSATERYFEEAIEMTTFVLVHGAFGSAAELAPVIAELETLGHRAIAVDLPCTDPAATFDDYARSVVEAMAGIEGPVVVVGHWRAARRSRSCPAGPASTAWSVRDGLRSRAGALDSGHRRRRDP